MDIIRKMTYEYNNVIYDNYDDAAAAKRKDVESHLTNDDYYFADGSGKPIFFNEIECNITKANDLIYSVIQNPIALKLLSELKTKYKMELPDKEGPMRWDNDIGSFITPEEDLEDLNIKWAPLGITFERKEP